MGLLLFLGCLTFIFGFIFGLLDWPKVTSNSNSRRENMRRGRSSNQSTNVKIKMAAEPNPWSVNRMMRIIIQDDTYRDVINWRSLRESFLPSMFRLEDSGNNSESKAFLLMVEPEDGIIAVKAYIQEEKGIPFKKQKLLNEEGRVLRDDQTLLSAKIEKGSTLILCYAPRTQISVRTHTGRTIKLLVENDDTIRDVKAAIQEKVGIRFHKQGLLYDGTHLTGDKLLVHCGIQYDNVLDLHLHICGC